MTIRRIHYLNSPENLDRKILRIVNKIYGRIYIFRGPMTPTCIIDERHLEVKTFKVPQYNINAFLDLSIALAA